MHGFLYAELCGNVSADPSSGDCSDVFLHRKEKRKGSLCDHFCYTVCLLAGVLGYIFQGKMDILQSWKQITEKQQYDLQSIQTENDGILLDYKGNRLKILPEMTDAGETLRAVENETETQMAKWDLEKDCQDMKIWNLMLICRMIRNI